MNLIVRRVAGLVALICVTVIVPALAGWRPIGAWWALVWAATAMGGGAVLLAQSVTSTRSGSVTAGLVSGYAVLRLMLITGVVAAVCGLLGGFMPGATFAVDLIGLFATIAATTYVILGSAVIGQNIHRIADQDARVDDVRAEHRMAGRSVFSAGARLASIPWSPETGSAMVLDRLQRRARTIEHALVHSHGGGVGALEGHQSRGGPRWDTNVLRPLVEELDSAVEVLIAQPANTDALARVESALARLERELSAAELF
jgi:hypothetical protein